MISVCAYAGRVMEEESIGQNCLLCDSQEEEEKGEKEGGHSGGDIAPSHAPTLLSSFSILALPPKVCAATQSRNLIGTPSVEESIG